MTEEQIKEMARRFLQWKLPDDFHPDGGISFKAAFNEHTAHPVRHEPVGTNLLTFAQAVEMVRHMVAALEAQPAQEPVAHWYTGPTEEQATAALRAKLAEVERAAYERGVREASQTAFCHSDNRPSRYSMDWNDGYIDGCRGANEAILALLTQEGR